MGQWMLVGLLLDQGLAGYSANRPSNGQVSVTLRRRLRILALDSAGSITVTVTTTLCRPANPPALRST